MHLKFIKLFENYSKDPSIDSSEVSHTWSEIRDSIQMKRPFVIVVFRTVESYLDALEKSLVEFDCVKQTAILNFNGKRKKYPSIFFVRDKDSDFSTKVRNLFEEHDLKYAIVGDAGSEYAKLYTKDGSSSEIGNELVSTLEPKDFGTEDCFKIGSTYYRFIEFES